jgi:hypothetical protein
MWLQNIDSRDLGWKISECNILRDLGGIRLSGLPCGMKSRFPSGMTTRGAKAEAKQIPFGNDNKRGKSRNKADSLRGMTTRKAKAEREATAKAKRLRGAQPHLFNSLFLL